jgi:hypothetical protein
MSVTYKGYTLNSLGDTPWYPTELALFEAILDRLPNAGQTYVSTQHRHSTLGQPTSGAIKVTVDDSGNVILNGMGSGVLTSVCGLLGVTGFGAVAGGTVATGLTGLNPAQMLYGDAQQSATLGFTGGTFIVAYPSTAKIGRLAAGVMNSDPDAALTVSQNGNNYSMRFVDINGVFDNNIHNLCTGPVMGQIIGAGAQEDGGMAIYGIGMTGAPGINLIGVQASPAGTTAKSVVSLSGYKSNGSQGLADLADADKLLTINNGTTNKVTVLGNGYAGFGTDVPYVQLHVQESVALTNNVNQVARLVTKSSATGIVGYGEQFDLILDDASSMNLQAASIQAKITGFTGGDRSTSMILRSGNTSGGADVGLEVRHEQSDVNPGGNHITVYSRNPSTDNPLITTEGSNTNSTILIKGKGTGDVCSLPITDYSGSLGATGFGPPTSTNVRVHRLGNMVDIEYSLGGYTGIANLRQAQVPYTNNSGMAITALMHAQYDGTESVGEVILNNGTKTMQFFRGLNFDSWPTIGVTTHVQGHIRYYTEDPV